MSDIAKKPDRFVHIAGDPERDEEFRGTFYELRKRKVWFSNEIRIEHARLKESLWRYIRNSRFFVALTSPFIYSCVIPFMILDVFVTVYQAFSFPIYGIPKARRSDYIIFDRGKLCYLNFLERVNCAYCSYANGLMAFVVEVAARTEQHWCPIRHAHRIPHPHDRYAHFLSYGDAKAYRARIEEVRTDFQDVQPDK
jgi:hypothetical protein